MAVWPAPNPIFDIPSTLNTFERELFRRILAQACVSDTVPENIFLHNRALDFSKSYDSYRTIKDVVGVIGTKKFLTSKSLLTYLTTSRGTYLL